MIIQFILIEPKVPENIGASARAINTMGFNNLVLVNPCNFLEGKSRWVAHGSFEILENASVCGSLEEAVEGSDLVIGTTARKRTVKHDYVDIKDLSGHIHAKSENLQTVAIVFGREESGMTNDELKLCDITSSVPIIKPFPSLNLSQAVMLYAYELSQFSQTRPPDSIKSGNGLSMRALKIKVRDLLLSAGIEENDNKFGRIMERVSFLNSDDMNLLHSICNILEGDIKRKK